jgi:hypothetical protein
VAEAETAAARFRAAAVEAVEWAARKAALKAGAATAACAAEEAQAAGVALAATGDPGLLSWVEFLVDGGSQVHVVRDMRLCDMRSASVATVTGISGGDIRVQEGAQVQAAIPGGADVAFSVCHGVSSHYNVLSESALLDAGIRVYKEADGDFDVPAMCLRWQGTGRCVPVERRSGLYFASLQLRVPLAATAEEAAMAAAEGGVEARLPGVCAAEGRAGPHAVPRGTQETAGAAAALEASWLVAVLVLAEQTIVGPARPASFAQQLATYLGVGSDQYDSDSSEASGSSAMGDLEAAEVGD